MQQVICLWGLCLSHIFNKNEKEKNADFKTPIIRVRVPKSLHVLNKLQIRQAWIIISERHFIVYCWAWPWWTLSTSSQSFQGQSYHGRLADQETVSMICQTRYRVSIYFCLALTRLSKAVCYKGLIFHRLSHFKVSLIVV